MEGLQTPTLHVGVEGGAVGRGRMRQDIPGTRRPQQYLTLPSRNQSMCCSPRGVLGQDLGVASPMLARESCWEGHNRWENVWEASQCAWASRGWEVSCRHAASVTIASAAAVRTLWEER